MGSEITSADRELLAAHSDAKRADGRLYNTVQTSDALAAIAALRFQLEAVTAERDRLACNDRTRTIARVTEAHAAVNDKAWQITRLTDLLTRAGDFLGSPGFTETLTVWKAYGDTQKICITEPIRHDTAPLTVGHLRAAASLHSEIITALEGK